MRKTPKLRFGEFSGEWEEKVLGDIFDLYTTNSYSRDCLNEKSGSVKNIHYGDIHMKFPTILDIQNTDIPYISEKIDIRKIPIESYCKEGDVIIADASEDYDDIGKSIEVKNIGNEKVVSGLHTLLARDNKGITQNGYRGYMLLNSNVRKQIKVLAAGAKVLGISKANINKVVLYIPQNDEQNKLASFFSLIDKKIEKQQEKVETLEEYKKGIMQRIFSQEIRFMDENGEEYPKWKKVHFKNLFEEVKEKTSDTEKHKLYSLTIENGVVPKSERYEREFLVTKEEENYKIVHKNEYVYNPMNLRFGALARHIGENPVSVSGYYNIFKTIDNCSYGFLDNFLKTNRMMYIYNTIATGSLVEKRRVHFSQFIELSLPMPSIKEQQKIAKLLLTIDKKLDKEKEKLEQLKELKKGLLQQMFV